MSTYSENGKSEETQGSVSVIQKILIEMGKSPNTYKKYAKETVEDVVKEIKKGEIYWKRDPDDPLSGAYYTVVQNHTMDEEAKAISRIIKDFDESDLAKSGIKIEDNQQLLMYRLYELNCNKQLDIKNISVDDFNTLAKYADWFGKIGNVADILEYGGYAANAVSAYLDGNTKGVTDEFAKAIGSAASGFIAQQLAGVLITTFAVTNPLVAFVTFAVLGLIGSAIGDEVAEGWKMIWDEIVGLFDDAGAYTYPVDPLIFDLNGDGVKTVALADGVHFDFDKNGFAEKIGWVSAEDGLLVRDLDKNGKIDSGRELMGDLTELSDDLLAANGFEALAYFDANADGVIDAKDDIYSELQIWQDKNQNGVVDDGELMSLSEAGIASINLAYENIDVTDESGNGHSQSGYYTRTDGTTLSVEDVWFEKDASNTVVNDSTGQIMLDETDDIAGLPDIQGRGNQYSLHQAMLRDKTGVLKQLVEDYIAETDSAARKSMLPEIIYAWTGVSDVEVNSRGNAISDARKLAALEVISGRKFNSAYGSNPVQQAGVYLEEAFIKLVDLYYGQLEMQTTYANDYAELYMNIDFDESGNIIYDITSVAERYMAEYEENLIEGRKHILGFVDNLRKTGMDLKIGKETIYQTFSITNSDLYHVIDYQGDDVISGSNKDDILIGEIGNDTLNGGAGADTYIFNLGAGEDIINNYDASNWYNDKIVFGEDVREEDIKVYRSGNDLVFVNVTSDDKITVKNALADGNGWYYIGSVEFADGTVWDREYIQEVTRHYVGTDGDDVMNGVNGGYNYNNNETFNGEAGNDTINGSNGNDVLIGGTGNDTLNGGAGADTYIFNLGDGEDIINNYDASNWYNDKIVFGEDVREEDIKVYRSGNDLVFVNVTSDDKITVKNALADGNGWYYIGSVEFADGTVWDREYIQEVTRHYVGTDGDDVMNGVNGGYNYNSDEVFHGGAGNDSISGGIGNDVYTFSKGDGQDIIYESAGSDKILFDDSISVEQLKFARFGDNLEISIIGQDDSITITNHFYSTANRVEEIQISDGRMIDYTKLNVIIQEMAAFESTTGMAWEDAIVNNNEQAKEMVDQWWLNE